MFVFILLKFVQNDLTARLYAKYHSVGCKSMQYAVEANMIIYKVFITKTH